MAHPEVLREVGDKLAENDRLAATKASTDAIAKFRGQLEHDPRDFVANPNGRVTVVEFFDYRCGYCKLAAPEVVQLIDGEPRHDPASSSSSFQSSARSPTAPPRSRSPAKPRPRACNSTRLLMSEKALDDATLDRHLAELPASTRPRCARPPPDLR